jgi:hypothetical protein
VFLQLRLNVEQSIVPSSGPRSVALAPARARTFAVGAAQSRRREEQGESSECDTALSAEGVRQREAAMMASRRTNGYHDASGSDD